MSWWIGKQRAWTGSLVQKKGLTISHKVHLSESLSAATPHFLNILQPPQTTARAEDKVFKLMSLWWRFYTHTCPCAPKANSHLITQNSFRLILSLHSFNNFIIFQMSKASSETQGKILTTSTCLNQKMHYYSSNIQWGRVETLIPE